MPRPLPLTPLELLLAQLPFLSWPSAYHAWSNSLPFCKTLPPPASLSPAGQNALRVALARQANADLRDFLAGVQCWRTAPRPPPAPAPPVVDREGAACLREICPGDGPALLAVPSLINRWHILDLLPDHSLLRFLGTLGRRVLVLDWGVPGPAEQTYDVGRYVAAVLCPLLQRQAGAVDILGYCMGGLLAVAAGVLLPERVRRAVLLAVPWDFQAGDPHAAALARAALTQYQPALRPERGLAPAAQRDIFAQLQPLAAWRKWRRLGRLPADSAAVRRLIVTEDWLQDGVPLAAPAARECLHDWYQENLPARNGWQVADQIIDPARLFCPALVVVPQRDRLVPPQSALALARALPAATTLSVPFGHIGVIASERGPSLLWPRLRDFLAAP